MARKSFARNSDGESGDTAIDDGSIITANGDLDPTSTTDSESFGASGDAINPGDIISSEPGNSDTGSSGTGKRRGRKPGTKNKPRNAKETPQDIAGALLSLHYMMAKLMDVQELVIDENEGDQMAKAILRVNALYNDFVIPETVLAWGGLLMATGGVYGPRIAAYNMRKAEERKKKPIVMEATRIS